MADPPRGLAAEVDPYDLDELTALIESWAEKHELDLYRDQVRELASGVLRSDWFVAASGAGELLSEIRGE